MPSPADPCASASDFHRAAAGFQTAARRHPDRIVESAYRLADRTVRLRVVGPELAAECAPPLAHLRASEAAAEPFLTIDVWHEAETGVAAERPCLPSPLDSYGVMTASADGRYVAEHRPHSGAWLDRRERRIFAWVASAGRLHLDERARPWHRALAVALGDLGIQTVHAGLVAWQGRGALLVGQGGAGKSTTSICCLLNGLAYLSDDFVGLAAAPDGDFVGHSLYNSALIRLGHLNGYHALAAACRPGHYPDEEKSMVCFSRMDGARLAAKVAIRAVLFPRVAGRADTEIAPLAPRAALLALAPSLLLCRTGVGARGMQRLAALVERVPSYRLELGHDLRQVAPTVTNLLSPS
jgi:hypothetical protein